MIKDLGQHLMRSISLKAIQSNPIHYITLHYLDLKILKTNCCSSPDLSGTELLALARDDSATNGEFDSIRFNPDGSLLIKTLLDCRLNPFVFNTKLDSRLGIQTAEARIKPIDITIVQSTLFNKGCGDVSYNTKILQIVE
eukprot:m.25397 g.25397  ORF g.25397 m.25397 type:complete len:140 (-) comp9190_c0_seq2:1676-2095(-)